MIEHGAELEGWRFIKRFEIVLISAGLQKPHSKREKTKAKSNSDKQVAFDREQRKAALLLDCMRDLGMVVFETWDIDVSKMQYISLRKPLEKHFESDKKIVATRHRFLSQEQQTGELIDKYIEAREGWQDMQIWGPARQAGVADTNQRDRGQQIEEEAAGREGFGPK